MSWKLIKQHLLPDALQLCVRVRRAGELCCDGRGEFQLAQRQFQFAGIALRPALRRNRCLGAVRGVELAGPNRVGVATFLDMPEEFLRPGAARTGGKTVEVFFARQASRCSSPGAAAAVADAETASCPDTSLSIKRSAAFAQRGGRGGSCCRCLPAAYAPAPPSRRHLAIKTLLMRVPRHPIP